MKFSTFELSFTGFMYRVILMMTVVIVGVLTNQFWMLFVAPFIFISLMLGLKITFNEKVEKAKVVKLKTNRTLKKVS